MCTVTHNLTSRATTATPRFPTPSRTMPQSHVIWCNLPFAASIALPRLKLLDGVFHQGHTLHLVDATTSPDLARAWFDGASIVFGQPPVEALLANQRLRW